MKTENVIVMNGLAYRELTAQERAELAPSWSEFVNHAGRFSVHSGIARGPRGGALLQIWDHETNAEHSTWIHVV